LGREIERGRRRTAATLVIVGTYYVVVTR
jgi:hypothetical protein